MATQFIKAYKTESAAIKAATKLNKQNSGFTYFTERSLMNSDWLVVKTDLAIVKVKPVPYRQSTAYLNK